MTKPIPGRWPPGHPRPMALLDPDRLKFIADRYYANEKVSDIARALGITTTAVSGILKAAGMSRPRLVLNPDGFNAQNRAKCRARCEAIWGMPREGRAAVISEYGRLPMKRYSAQRSLARCRGIGWEITFAQWWAIWVASGRWNERGQGSGYCMARRGDVGPYSPANVYICSGRQNVADMHVNRRLRNAAATA